MVKTPLIMRPIRVVACGVVILSRELVTRHSHAWEAAGYVSCRCVCFVSSKLVMFALIHRGRGQTTRCALGHGVLTRNPDDAGLNSLCRGPMTIPSRLK